MKTDNDIEYGRCVSEIEIRTALARHLANEARLSKCILAAEAVYGFENRRADFIKLDDNIHAFEIKSDYDNTSRLRGQLAEYNKTFVFVTVVTTAKHLTDIRKIASRKIGLMVFNGRSLEQVRKPAANKQLSKIHLVEGTTKSRLLRELPNNFQNRCVSEIRIEAAKILTIKLLRRLFHAELVDRFSESSAIFFPETDAQFIPEDLLLLRRGSRLFA